MLLSQPALAEDRTLPTQAGAIKVETIAKGLHNPWGLAFLPDGQMLVTERSGTLRFVSKDGTISKPLSGVPEVFAEGQDGLLDVAIDPDFSRIIPQAGKNYGRPIVSWGSHYDGRKIPEPPTYPEFADAIYHWNPVISPSRMTFYIADAIPAWRGNLLIGGLSSQAIVRLALDGETVTAEERIPMGARIRDVVQGLTVRSLRFTDEYDGKILRLAFENSPK